MNYPMEIIHNFCMPPFLACVKVSIFFILIRINDTICFLGVHLIFFGIPMRAFSITTIFLLPNFFEYFFFFYARFLYVCILKIKK